MDESASGFRLCSAPLGHDGDHVPGERVRRGDPGVPPEPDERDYPGPQLADATPTDGPLQDTQYPPVGMAPAAVSTPTALDEQPVDPEGDAAYWRAKAETAQGALAGAMESIDYARAEADKRADEVSRLRSTWTPPTDDEPDRVGEDGRSILVGIPQPVLSVYVPADYPQVADQLAEAAEAFVRDMRAAWARLPNRSRPYEAHAALLEALSAYHKAKNRSG